GASSSTTRIGARSVICYSELNRCTQCNRRLECRILHVPTRPDRKVSILDVMGPVMVGPSSSHTAGTARLGRVAREILDEDPVAVHFYLHPPLATTYRGHGSDFALVGGSIGLNVDDPRIPKAIR